MQKNKPRISGTGNGKTMILSNIAICGSQKSEFIQNQKENRLLSSLETKTPLRKIPLVGAVLF